MRAFYGSRFSKNMTATPEGFLICHNVPIGRTGWYDYFAKEVGSIDLPPKQVVRVYRSPEEVFNDVAVASFEGKVLTDDHPSEAVTPSNATRYSRGHIQNVRRGSGDESDCLLADIIVNDKLLIKEIQDGKREVSCGYECSYEPQEDGTFLQVQICGNHVAVVSSGRAGDRIAIKDSNTINGYEPEGELRVANKIALPKKRNGRITDFLAAWGLKQLAMDAEPDEIKEAVDALADERAAEKTEDADLGGGGGPAPAAAAPEGNPEVKALAEQVAKLTEMVTAIGQAMAQPAADEGDPIDAAIAQMGGGAQDGEDPASVTIPAEAMDDEGPVAAPEDLPKSAITADAAIKIKALRAMKPALAAITDPVQRKLATDAAIAAVRGAKPAATQPVTYATVINRKQPAQDGAPKKVTAEDHANLGKEIAKKYNPHYKEKA